MFEVHEAMKYLRLITDFLTAYCVLENHFYHFGNAEVNSCYMCYTPVETAEHICLYARV